MKSEAGWFPDPSDGSSELYFDGEKWTGEKRLKNADKARTTSNESISFNLPISAKFFDKEHISRILIVSLLLIAGFFLFKTQIDHNNKKKFEEAQAARQEVQIQALLAAEREKNDITWVPAGYTAWYANKTIAYKWVRNASNDCYDCRFWTVEVIAKNGCSDGIYGELNIERNGTVISYTNDSLSFLAPLQPGRLSFETYQTGSFTGTLTQLNCRPT